MDHKEDVVQTSGCKTLLIRHLPAELSQDEKEDLLKYFGAKSVRVFSNTGRMVSCAALTPGESLPLQIRLCIFNSLFHFHRNMRPLQHLEVRSRQQM